MNINIILSDTKITINMDKTICINISTDRVHRDSKNAELQGS